MKLREIDTLQELEAERVRLQLEADAAKSYLAIKITETINNGRSVLSDKLSWPAVLGSLAAFGGSKLLSTSTQRPSGLSTGKPSWLSGVRQGLELIESNDSQKWLQALPMLLDFWRSR